jgi:2-amino-4-hydroxy-6-hydroxymethyldihydropteridine diphosphokinase
LSVGSNTGERETAVLGVPRLLEEHGVGRRALMSSLYETAPVGDGQMPFFINAVVEFEPLLLPLDLLKRLKEMEKAKGRTGSRGDPRPLDIDIVAWGATTVRSETLTIPHPRYRERAFVLIPLGEISPFFVCPETGRSIEELLSSLPEDQYVSRVSSRRTFLAGGGASD